MKRNETEEKKAENERRELQRKRWECKLKNVKNYKVYVC